jgi:hypothetical protein
MIHFFQKATKRKSVIWQTIQHILYAVLKILKIGNKNSESLNASSIYLVLCISISGIFPICKDHFCGDGDENHPKPIVAILLAQCPSN